jgi:hypothetical protein
MLLEAILKRMAFFIHFAFVGDEILNNTRHCKLELKKNSSIEM